MSSPLSVPKLPAMPVFDAKRDGNPFEWIVRQAPIVRAQRQDTQRQVRIARRVQVGSRNYSED